MLVIFDLDDTLIDTSGCVVPLKLRDSLQAMVDKGLRAGSFHEALSLLYEVDSTSPNGEQTLRSFLKKINADDYFLRAGIEEMYKPVPEEIEIKQLENASEVLLELGQKNTLAMVSKGRVELQFQKMRKAGIGKNIFSKIIITEDYNKKNKYQKIMGELNFIPGNTIVVGDKFYSDLLPAKELGIKTVQMLWGRALKFPEEGADYKINKLRELTVLLERWRKG